LNKENIMSEPRLEDIGDYNSLKGEKKKVVWAVVLAGLLIGTVYTIAYSIYDNEEDTIVVEESYKKVPMY
ncbi:MAG: hypothetical protein U9P72_00845, partial [Campylobacterota bacterium]|nr:hypothetical protein [Campylobacterota bacterium]